MNNEEGKNMVSNYQHLLTRLNRRRIMKKKRRKFHKKKRGFFAFLLIITQLKENRKTVVKTLRV